MFSWHVGYWGDILASTSTKNKAPNLLSYWGFSAVHCSQDSSSVQGGFWPVQTSVLEEGLGSKASNLSALHRDIWGGFLLTLSPSVKQMLPGKCSSLPVSHFFFMLLKKHTRLYILFACCNWGIQRLMLQEAALNLIDWAAGHGTAAVEGITPCTAPTSRSSPTPSTRPSCVSPAVAPRLLPGRNTQLIPPAPICCRTHSV